jgi:hypothetical protein
MGFIRRQIREKFEENKPKALQTDIRMISGCEDAVSTLDIFWIDSLKNNILNQTMCLSSLCL